MIVLLLLIFRRLMHLVCILFSKIELTKKVMCFICTLLEYLSEIYYSILLKDVVVRSKISSRRANCIRCWYFWTRPPLISRKKCGRKQAGRATSTSRDGRNTMSLPWPWTRCGDNKVIFSLSPCMFKTVPGSGDWNASTWRWALLLTILRLQM